MYILKALEKWSWIVARLGIEVNELYLPSMIFADDQLVLATGEGNIDIIFRKLIEEYEKCGLIVKRKK